MLNIESGVEFIESIEIFPEIIFFNAFNCLLCEYIIFSNESTFIAPCITSVLIETSPYPGSIFFNGVSNIKRDNNTKVMSVKRLNAEIRDSRET